MITKVNTNIRIDKDIKEQLQLKAKSMWTTLSNIFNMYAYKFINTWEIEYYKWKDNFNNIKIEIEEIKWSEEFYKSDDYKKWKQILASI